MMVLQQCYEKVDTLDAEIIEDGKVNLSDITTESESDKEIHVQKSKL